MISSEKTEGRWPVTLYSGFEVDLEVPDVAEMIALESRMHDDIRFYRHARKSMRTEYTVKHELYIVHYDVVTTRDKKGRKTVFPRLRYFTVEGRKDKWLKITRRKFLEYLVLRLPIKFETQRKWAKIIGYEG